MKSAPLACALIATVLVTVLAGLSAVSATAQAGRPASPAEPAGETVEQIVSRENSLFDISRSRLTVGRDGKAYLSCSQKAGGFVLRMTLEGKEKFGGKIVYAVHNVTANADGTVASANGHFAHQVTVYDTGLREAGKLRDFLVSDKVGWNAPCHVEAGAGGDFYGLDQHRDRIVRISPRAKVVTTYSLPHEPAGKKGAARDFRVSERTEAFYVRCHGGDIRRVGFDGRAQWKCPVRNTSAFDVDENGTLHVLPNRGKSVKRFSPRGEELDRIGLEMGEGEPGKHRFGTLRVHGGHLVLSRRHATELFQRYDLKTGAFRQAVHMDHVRLAAEFPRLVWTAGERLPFRIEFDAGGESIRPRRPGSVVDPTGPRRDVRTLPPARPRWRVWARHYEASDYREFELAGDVLEVPGDCAGLYVVKVTPEVSPVEYRAPSEYMVRAFVEIRKSRSRGTVTVLTPNARVFYGRGEEIPFSVVARSPEAGLEVPATVSLVHETNTVAEVEATVKTGADPAEFVLPESLTSSLVPGEYRLSVTAPGRADTAVVPTARPGRDDAVDRTTREFTCVGQPLTIGPGIERDRFFRVQYGDYGFHYARHPDATFWNAPDYVRADVARKRKLGLNLVVDRLGSRLTRGHEKWVNSHGQDAERLALRRRLEADPAAVSPGKADIASPLLGTMAQYSAYGIREMAILMMNDAGLPIGTGHDKRKPEDLKETLRCVTRYMKPYPAFRGWTWSSNWWNFGNRGANAAETPQDKKAYKAARERAAQTGAWAPILEKVSSRCIGFAVEAQELFNGTLREIAPDLVTAVAAPYRRVEAYPPVTLGNVDEVDLHIQWEQLAIPYTEPFNVDFYRRPGKRAWAHPEVWNDDGTGGQILSNLFMSIMRGSDGVGISGKIPAWTDVDDPRTSHLGIPSVFRSLNRFCERYGPWLMALESDDDVAIVASGRMFRIDTWDGAHTGLHFSRLLEAYITCLHAHRPASVIFVEDLDGDTLKRFKAVLVVDQRVEMEPPLAEALRAAKAAGVAVFYDGTCREDLVRGFTPLGVSFDKLEKDRCPMGDDAVYWRFLGYARANLPALLEKLGALVPPVAAVPNDGILLSRRKSGRGRYVFVVNYTLPKLDPGHLWRMNLGLTSRVPLRAPVRLAGAGGGAVYEVLAMRRALPEDGVLQADLRCHPARIFAVLPAAIEKVELSGPRHTKGGEPFTWRVRVLNESGEPIDASVPVGLRLLARNGQVLQEHFGAVGPSGAEGAMVAPIKALRGGHILEATELLSGRSVQLPLSHVHARVPVTIPARGGGD